MKSTIGIVLVLLLSVGCLSAQNVLLKNYNPHQLELRLNSGFSLNNAEVLTGSQQYDNTICPEYSFSVFYNYLFSEKFSMSAGIDYGWRKFSYNSHINPNVDGYYPSYLWMPNHYVKFWKYELNGNYMFPISETFKLKASFGGGVADYRGGGYSISGMADELINFGYHSDVAPFISTGISIIRPFKNANELSLKLKYLYSFKNIIHGHYSFPSVESTGLLLSTGNNVSVSIGYTITGNKKNDRFNELLAENDKLTAKKELRKELNYINPNSLFICLYGANGGSITKISDPAGYLINGVDADLFAGLNIEKGIKNNCFVEADYHFMMYNDVLNIKDFVESYSHNAFKSHVISIGAGYRFIINEKYRIVDFHAGIFSGFTKSKKGSTSTESYPRAMGINNEMFEYQIEKTNTINSQILAGLYVGVSKDLRITRNTYFTLSYKFQYGLNPVYVSTIDYTSNQFAGTKTVSSKLDGTAHLLQLGLKIKLQ